MMYNVLIMNYQNVQINSLHHSRLFWKELGCV